MELFDTHFHRDESISPASAVREIHAQQQKASDQTADIRMAAMGCDFGSSHAAAEFAAAVHACCFAAGVHPHEAEKYAANRKDFSVFKNLPDFAAVGEIGLDYFYDFAGHDIQKQVFAEFLDNALKWQKPAVVHLRDKDERFDAYDDAIALLAGFAASGGRFVIHSYTGGVSYLPEFAKLGAYFGVNGMVTFKKAENIRTQLPLIPADRLLLETDSPYLAPVPFRGSTNNPGNITLIARTAAEVLGKSTADLAAQTTANAVKFFGL